MRLSAALLLSTALATSACARDAQTETETATQDTAAAPVAAPQPSFDFPEDAWRDIDPENTIYIETETGRVVVELAPEFAPRHVERMKTLSREQFYDFLVWHRVIDGFVAQGGGSRANPNHGTDLPDLPAEFTVRRGAELTVTELQDRIVNERTVPQMAKAGFWNGFQAGTQPIAQAMISMDGQVQSWLLHCTGAASMARTNDPNSAGSQFYITRGNAEHLNAQYTVWGRVRAGQEHIEAIPVGTYMQDLDFRPDSIRSMRVASDLPEAERTTVQVVDTNSAAFAAYLDTLRDETGALPDVCDITVPTRIQE